MTTEPMNNVRDESETIILPVSEYEALLEKAEAYDDLVALDEHERRVEAGTEELIPSDLVEALIKGASPIKVWRKHRGYSQTQLGEAVGVSQAYIAQLETGQRQGKPDLFKKMAQALGVAVDDLI